MTAPYRTFDGTCRVEVSANVTKASVSKTAADAGPGRGSSRQVKKMPMEMI